MEMALQEADEMAGGAGSAARVAELEAYVAELQEQVRGLEARRVEAKRALRHKKHGK